MVRYTNKPEKAVIHLMVVDDMPAKAIAKEVDIGIHQARRYRAKYKLSTSTSASSATRLATGSGQPWLAQYSQARTSNYSRRHHTSTTTRTAAASTTTSKTPSARKTINGQDVKAPRR
ncbi:hypothetical protein B0T25DRAFT_563268 [Lasiosphaeria hispida]|uniref:Uncharacterized protein n=1 Tax=Lasiosphaeria hispida TaxID=260671 RepID=A0AAJ0HX06_9PEZI|nr:hypothetical protein B0T25DRAFT_563268 [Lasiosphaeria hispida]